MGDGQFLSSEREDNHVHETYATDLGFVSQLTCQPRHPNRLGAGILR